MSTIRTETLVSTSMRLDWLEMIYKRWQKSGLPLNAEGTRVLLALSSSDLDASDLTWIFELMREDSGFKFLQAFLPPSPLDTEFTKTEWIECQKTASTAELREQRNRYDAAHKALARSKSNEGFVLASSAYKHYLNALIAKAMKHDSRRVALHLAKAMFASLMIEFARDPTTRSSKIGDLWENTFKILASETPIDFNSLPDGSSEIRAQASA